MKIVNYFKETYDELVHKVTWPTAANLQDSVIKVSIASLIIIFIVLLMDLFFNFIMKLMFF
ncbi:preprotein translocase subunit SecE [Bacteroidales bacterium OttesenSCG-928-E04]|nr:preprotein translocase subunit SecE [Bacteroidales bacterium OttesenSCG-928-E04]MDL2325703.1 preprotein translocase subunit SecE [Bacteroidales bacterium OttesenSCG-928-A14]